MAGTETRVIRSGRRTNAERSEIAATEAIAFLDDVRDTVDMAQVGIMRLRAECTCGAAEKILNELYAATHQS